MSLLHQDSPEEIDDAALGEELTKGTSHVVIATIAAAVLVSIAIAAYFLLGEKPPMATGDVLQVWAHPLHSVSSGFDANGAPMAQESSDHVLVFARVRLHNQSKQPLFLHEVRANATLADGVHTSYAATKTDYDRVFIAYPELAALHGAGLSQEATLDPGQTLEGDFVASFRVTKQEWDARKDLNFAFAFRYQKGLVLTPHSAVIEQ
jgi:hypothetical protein